MARKNRYFTTGQLWHLTHRCHNRQFMLKFARDRDGYRALLREKLCRSGVDLFGYCLTSNHVHLLVHHRTGLEISAVMKSVAGEFAQAYNRRKRRSGAFWEDRYHATLVDSGAYLWRTIRHRLRLEIVAESSSDNGFVLRERADRYGGLAHVFGPKNRL